MTNDLTSGMQYHYDAGNMLKTVGSITYWYDNDGRRYIKWNNGVPVKSYFYGAGGEILAEGSGGSTLTAEYIFFNGKRLARVDLPGNAVHYYLSDALNSTSMEVSSAGVIENESDYYPWGGELKFTASDPANPYKFTGKERDTETGLDYFGARYYSNGLGRFSTPDWGTTPDPVPYAELEDPQTLNLYSYVRNIPTVEVDDNGHFASGNVRCYLTCQKKQFEDDQIDFVTRIFTLALTAYVSLRNTVNQTPPATTKEQPAQSTPADPNQQQKDGSKKSSSQQRLTNKEAKSLAKKLGYDKEVKDPPFNSHGNKVFSNGRGLITADRDGHNGGVWKVFSNNGDRLGTYNADLTVKVGP